MDKEKENRPGDEPDDLAIAKRTTLGEMRATLAGENPEAAENFEIALAKVKSLLNFDEDDIYFQSFSGYTMGEAGPKGIGLDYIVAMHPVNRIAEVLTHEILHAKGDVENEGLVEACTNALLKSSSEDGLQMTDVYQKALENFSKFIDRISEGRDKNNVLFIVYNLYYSGKYDDIYSLYDDRFIKAKERNDKELDEAWDFFRETFPELDIHSTNLNNGKFEVKDNVRTEALSELDLKSSKAKEKEKTEDEETATGIA